MCHVVVTARDEPLVGIRDIHKNLAGTSGRSGTDPFIVASHLRKDRVRLGHPAGQRTEKPQIGRPCQRMPLEMFIDAEDPDPQ